MLEIKNNVQFDELIKDNSRVLVDFYAQWCGPCKMIAPVLETLASENTDVVIAKLDVDIAENRETVKKFNVMSIPTLMMFVDGVLVNVANGYQSKNQLEKLIAK